MPKKILIEHEEPYEATYIIVAEFAFRCCEKGYNWEKTRQMLLEKIPQAMQDYRKQE